MMDHTPFIIGAFTITLGATALKLLLDWRAMRSAERRIEELKR